MITIILFNSIIYDHIKFDIILLKIENNMIIKKMRSPIFSIQNNFFYKTYMLIVYDKNNKDND